MNFNTYLKNCRETYNFTQEELTHLLQDSDSIFTQLDIGTLSRWERAISNPSIDKKLKIMEFFQEHSSLAFPCFNAENYEDIQDQICHNAIENIIGSSKELILNFPSHYIMVDDLKITELQDIKNIDNIIEISVSLDQEFTKHFSQLQDDHFREWAIHPSSFFLICEYKEQFFGLLFSLRLKPNIFEKLINLEMQEKDLTTDDFAGVGEEGCEYLLNFFSHSQKSAALLFIRYYTFLIANQRDILEVGVATMMKEGETFVERLNLSHYRDIEQDNHTISFYRSPLKQMLVNEAIIKTIFSK